MYWIQQDFTIIRFKVSSYTYRLIRSDGVSDTFTKDEPFSNSIQYKDFKTYIKALVLLGIPYEYITEVERV
jgi:hypothetical protein